MDPGYHTVHPPPRELALCGTNSTVWVSFTCIQTSAQLTSLFVHTRRMPHLKPHAPEQERDVGDSVHIAIRHLGSGTSFDQSRSLFLIGENIKAPWMTDFPYPRRLLLSGCGPSLLGCCLQSLGLPRTLRFLCCHFGKGW